MNTVFIADDELTIRQGLKCIIEWESLGFKITGEASNGEEALHFILENKPDVAMLDIRMPRKSGLDVAKSAREQGYQGKIIILTGFSDFKYAQEAIRCNVEYFLTKPIDEDELTETVMKIGQILSKEAIQKKTFDHYRDKARTMILYDILSGKAPIDDYHAKDMGIDAERYQVVIYESYSHHKTMTYHFSDLLKVTNNDNSSYENVTIDNNEILLLKGNFILEKFQRFLEHYDREQKPQANSPLDSLFITYGRIVDNINDVSISYGEALRLLQRRFFCEHRQHTIGYQELPETQNQDNTIEFDNDILQEYREKLIGYIQAAKRNQVAETLNELEQRLYYTKSSIPKIKLFLTDLYLSIKEKLSHLYHSANIPFPGNAEIIRQIDEKYYLYEIILLFTEQFEMIMRAIGNPSSDNVMDDIIHYIEHNYMDNIKLENIAPLFGYNSSYLGKIFNKKVGMGFNMFVDKVRIEASKKLLVNTELKVYEIAERVGYRNVDYFHTKFKKYVVQSPAEYRRQYRES